MRQGEGRQAKRARLAWRRATVASTSTLRSFSRNAVWLSLSALAPSRAPAWPPRLRRPGGGWRGVPAGPGRPRPRSYPHLVAVVVGSALDQTGVGLQVDDHLGAEAGQQLRRLGPCGGTRRVVPLAVTGFVRGERREDDRLQGRLVLGGAHHHLH